MINTTASTGQFPTGAVYEGGQVDLWDELVRVTADIENTGTVNGTEIAQLYIQVPDPKRPRVLRGFEKPFMTVGQKVTVSFPLTRRDLSVWDTVAQKWSLLSGVYGIYVGTSSRDLALEETFTI